MGYVADELDRLDEDLSAVIGSAWTKSTLACRNSQWSRFIKVCQDFGLSPIPADATTVARFLVWQSKSSKYSTCNNYLSAINVLHKFYGHDTDFRQCFLIKLMMKGLKSVLGDQSCQKRPFTVRELCEMYKSLNFESEDEIICWTIIILSFRSLLQKSNLVPTSPTDDAHVLHRWDVSFHSWGMMVRVTSIKTLKNSEYVLEIPVHYVWNLALCAASAVEYHMKVYPGHKDSLLFLRQGESGLEPVYYAQVLDQIKRCASRVGIDPTAVGCHSLRRSGAAHMHSIGVPLVDIICAGDWKYWITW